jgi:hypothetical protein
MTEENLSLVACFEKEKMSVVCDGLSSLVVGEEVLIPIAIETQSGVKSVKGSKLPTGLKIKKNKVTGEWFVTGKPKKVGVWNSVIKVTAKSGAVEQLPVTVTVSEFKIELPDWAVGKFWGVEQWFEEAEEDDNLDADLFDVIIDKQGLIKQWSGVEQDGNTWTEPYPRNCYLEKDHDAYKCSRNEVSPGIDDGYYDVDEQIVVTSILYGDYKIGVLTLDSRKYVIGHNGVYDRQYAELMQDPWAMVTRPKHLPDFSSTKDNILTIYFDSYYGNLSAQLTFQKNGRVDVKWDSSGGSTKCETRLLPYLYDNKRDIAYVKIPLISNGEIRRDSFSVLLDVAIPSPDKASAKGIDCSMIANSWQIYSISYIE